MYPAEIYLAVLYCAIIYPAMICRAVVYRVVMYLAVIPKLGKQLGHLCLCDSFRRIIQNLRSLVGIHFFFFLLWLKPWTAAPLSCSTFVCCSQIQFFVPRLQTQHIKFLIVAVQT